MREIKNKNAAGETVTIAVEVKPPPCPHCGSEHDHAAVERGEKIKPSGLVPVGAKPFTHHMGMLVAAHCTVCEKPSCLVIPNDELHSKGKAVWDAALVLMSQDVDEAEAKAVKRSERGLPPIIAAPVPWENVVHTEVARKEHSDTEMLLELLKEALGGEASVNYSGSVSLGARQVTDAEFNELKQKSKTEKEENINLH